MHLFTFVIIIYSLLNNDPTKQPRRTLPSRHIPQHDHRATNDKGKKRHHTNPEQQTPLASSN